MSDRADEGALRLSPASVPPPIPSLRAYILPVIQGRWVVLGVAGAVFLAALLSLRLVEPHYTATMIIGPTSAEGVTGMGIRVPALPSDLSVAPVTVGQGETLSDFARFQEAMTSLGVARELAASEELLQQIFPQMWDGEAQRWEPPSGIGALARRILLVLSGQTGWVAPDGRLLARHLKEHLKVASVGPTPMRRLSYRHPDRNVGIELLQRLYSVTDARLRAEAKRRSAAQIAFIRDRLGAVTMFEHRNVLMDLLSSHERNLMMIEADLPFAADLIEIPDAPLLPDWPDPLLILPLAAAAGLALGVAVVHIRAVWQGLLPS